jgi:hypothetical protein
MHKDNVLRSSQSGRKARPPHSAAVLDNCTRKTLYDDTGIQQVAEAMSNIMGFDHRRMRTVMAHLLKRICERPGEESRANGYLRVSGSSMLLGIRWNRWESISSA